MNRRKFTILSGGGLLLPFMNFDLNLNQPHDDIKELIRRMIAMNDERIPSALARQEKEETHKWYGGIKNDTEVFMAGHTAGFIRNLACSYVSEISRYYKSELLLTAMILGSEYLLNVQYSDGTIDLPTTNFHSPPDTGFAVEPLCLAYKLLDGPENKNLETLRKNLKTFLLNAGDAMIVGGIHTANHRWVVCMALARVNQLFPDEKYLRRIDQWLAEKIDIDPDGQYVERSTLIYTPLVNRCLITSARLTGKPELLDPVRKNLDMTLYYVHPNGEIATESSGRQDRYRQGTMQNYLYAYRYMAIHDQNGKFAAMYEQIRTIETEKLMFWLAYFLEDPFLLKPLPCSSSLPDHYVKEFYHSDLVRIRRGRMDATILSGNPTLLTFFKGHAALESIRLASAFFGKGQFNGQTFERFGGVFIMKQKLTGVYYQPLEKKDIPEDGNGWQVSRIKREQSEVQEQETVVSVSEKDGKVDLKITVTGTNNVPVAVELAFRFGGHLNGITKIEEIPNAYLANEGEMMKYSYNNDEITFGPGVRKHSWTQLRGALPKLEADCVYLTGFTPFETLIEIG